MLKNKIVSGLLMASAFVGASIVSRNASAALQSFNGYACSVSLFNKTVFIEPRSAASCGGSAINQVFLSTTGTYAVTDVQMMGVYQGLVQALIARKKIFFWYETTTGQIQTIYVYDK
jgi:hypothetical protein